MGRESNKLDDEVDALFRLPIAEFIGARKTLAARLKKDGRVEEADYVKTLVKPSISAWAVNQLYWNHREEFDHLISTGKRLRQAQTSGKIAVMREALDARRGALSHLSDLATTLLRDAGHNPTLDMLRRITTTLEAMSTYALLVGGPRPGRLTKDVDPPGFESLATFMSGAGPMERTEEPAQVSPLRKLKKTRQKSTPAIGISRHEEARQAKSAAAKAEESRQAKLAAAKVSLQNAKKSLADARARAQRLEAAQKKANAEAKVAEKLKREAEERFKKASAASETATSRAQSLTVEVEEAKKSSEDANRAVGKATRELERLFRQFPTKP